MAALKILSHKEAMQNKDKYTFSNAFASKARRTADGEHLDETVKGFMTTSIVNPIDKTKKTENLYCVTEEGSRFRVNELTFPNLTEGTKVRIVKESSEIEGVVRHFFTLDAITEVAKAGSKKLVTA